MLNLLHALGLLSVLATTSFATPVAIPLNSADAGAGGFVLEVCFGENRCQQFQSGCHDLKKEYWDQRATSFEVTSGHYCELHAMDGCIDGMTGRLDDVGKIVSDLPSQSIHTRSFNCFLKPKRF